tara:strand:+ start:312 stop:2111 length:1800 start_codon:yes stop_codon:yes gene_type:complete
MSSEIGISKFKNIGHVTCYMNSILSVIQQSNLLCDYILTGSFRDFLMFNLSKKDNENESNFENTIIYQLYKLFTVSASMNNGVVTPTSLRKVASLKDFSFRWASHQQQDSAEFLLFILEKITEEIGQKSIFIPGKINHKLDLSIDDSIRNIISSFENEQFVRNEFSPLINMFNGLCQRTTECSICKNKNSNFEPFRTFELEIPDQSKNADNKVTLYSCLEKWSEKEKLDDDVWDRLNVEKYTILSQLINFDFKKYHVVLKGKNLDLEVKNGDGDNILQETEKMGNYEWNSYFKKFKKRNKNGDSKSGKCADINLKNYKYSDHNIFQAFFYNLALGFIHLDRKYKNLYFPKYVKVSNSYPTFSTLFNGAFGRKIDEYNNFPFIIFWENENKYHIHPSLNMLMKNAMNEKKYDFGIVFVSVDARVGLEKDKGSFHANILIYNFKTETIEYFEPYGKSGVREDIHRILKEELCWNTGFKYLEPNDYLPVSSFQYLAFENNNYYLKPGDFGGFCLAWCFWYTEHRILNPSVEPKMLVNKLINRILKGKYNLVDYIRNFANDFHINIMKLLKEIGIKKERITNLHFKSKEEDKIFSFIIKNSSY